MKTLKKPLLLSIICLTLLAVAVAAAEESLEDIRRQAELGNATAQFSSGRRLFNAEGNFIGIITSKFVDESMEGIAFAIPADLALEI